MENIKAEKESFAKRKIALIFTGGTIGSTIRPSNKIIEPKLGSELFRELIKQKPEIEDKYEFIIRNPYNMLSENITPNDWGKIANSIALEINQSVDGIVVTHGTDTMPYTASAISFMLSEVSIPIVFTGSLIPPHEKGTDAVQNLYDSILFSAKSEKMGVFVIFRDRKDNHSKVFWGNRLRSISSYSNNFQSADNKSFAIIRNDTITYCGKYPTRNHLSKKVIIESRIESKVAYFKVYPGFDPWFIDKAVEYGAKGIILEIYHSGTACTTNHSKYSLISSIKSCVEKSIPIFGIPLHESQESNIYSTTRELLDAGLIHLNRMSLESMVVKLMWLLGNEKEIKKVIKRMNENIAGEIYTP